jgi:hypothetical protein
VEHCRAGSLLAKPPIHRVPHLPWLVDRDKALLHQLALSAALIDFAYTGADDSSVNMRRMDVAMRDVCNLITLLALRSVSRLVGGEQWNLVCQLCPLARSTTRVY